MNPFAFLIMAVILAAAAADDSKAFSEAAKDTSLAQACVRNAAEHNDHFDIRGNCSSSELCLITMLGSYCFRKITQYDRPSRFLLAASTFLPFCNEGEGADRAMCLDCCTSNVMAVEVAYYGSALNRNTFKIGSYVVRGRCRCHIKHEHEPLQGQ